MRAGTATAALAESFAAAHPEAAARALAGLPARDAAAFFDDRPTEIGAAVATYLTAQECAACLRLLGAARAAELLAEMPVDAVAAAVRRLEELERTALIGLLPEETARRVERLLRHEEGSAGALMEPSVLTVRVEATAGEAVDSLERDPSHLRYYLYVVDAGDRLLGVLDLRRLKTADRATAVRELMVEEVQRMPARARREAILQHPGWEIVHTLPVVDESNVLIGILRYETVRRLARLDQEARTPSDSVVGSLGELYWSGSQRVTTELLGMMRRGQ